MIILMILMLTNDYCFLIYIILVYMIMKLFGLMVTYCYSNGKKDDSLKANRSLTSVSLFEPHKPHVILLSTICAHPCYFLHTPNFRKVVSKIDGVTEEFPED
jgi:hypothetical protein